MEHLFRRQSSQTLSHSARVERAYAHSVSGGAGGHGTRISSASYGALLGSAVGSGYDFQSSVATAGKASIGNEKMAMQNLNDRLASYLEKVRSLEKANKSLEIKIVEATEKRGPAEARDYSKYNAIIKDLRAKIFDLVKENARLVLSIDNVRLATDDFKLKLESETSMRQAVEADIAGLRRILDETNVTRLHLEGEIEALNEEMIILRKNHETDVAELRSQISKFGVNVDVDGGHSPDLTKIMEEIRAKYEKIVHKNQEELKIWHETQMTEVQVQVTESSTALKEATTVVTETRRKQQALDIELQSALSLKAAFEASLRDLEMRYRLEVEKYNMIILRLQEELTNIRGDIDHNTRDYEMLLNIKVKLEAEIAEYRRLLDGEGEFKLEEALQEKKIQTKVVTVTQTLVDGKVVSESKDVKSSEKVASS